MCLEFVAENVNENVNRRKAVASESNNEKGSQFRQYIAGICACFAMLGISGYHVWPSPVLPFLTSKESAIRITEAQGALIVSMFQIGDLFGALLNPLIIDRIGRKYCILVSVISGLIGWIVINIATNYIHLCIARLLGGISQGSICSSLVIYLSEISETNIRGVLMNIMQLTENAGILLFTVIAPSMSYKLLNLTTLVAPILFCIIFVFMPESPYYYFMKHEDEKAIKVLERLRSGTKPADLASDIAKIKLTIQEDEENSKAAWQDLISKKQNRKGVLILTLIEITHQMTGIYTVFAYSQQILIDSESPLNPKYGVMIVNMFLLLASILGIGIIDRVRRRVLLLVSAFLEAFSFLAVGLFFFLKYYCEIDVSSITWLPLASLSLYVSVYTIGIAPVAFVLQGELFPMSTKGAATAFGSTVGGVFAFFGTIGYIPINKRFGIYSSFWIYAAISLISSLIIFWITPETKGKTLEEIQGMQNPDLQSKLDALPKKKATVETYI